METEFVACPTARLTLGERVVMHCFQPGPQTLYINPDHDSTLCASSGYHAASYARGLPWAFLRGHAGPSTHPRAAFDHYIASNIKLIGAIGRLGPSYQWRSSPRYSSQPWSRSPRMYTENVLKFDVALHWVNTHSRVRAVSS